MKSDKLNVDTELREVIELCSRYQKGSTIAQTPFCGINEKNEYVKKAVNVELYEAINTINTWKVWKSNPVNNLDETLKELADVYIFIFDMIDPEIVIFVLSGSMKLHLDNDRSKFLNEINISITINIFNELFKNKDLENDYRFQNTKIGNSIEYYRIFNNLIIGAIVNKINYNCSRKDHKQYGIQ